MRAAGRTCLKGNQFKMIEFFDFKQKYERMLAEMETFLAMLLEDSEFKNIEDNLVWLIGHAAVPDDKKIGYAARIHAIDQFYNPYTKIEKVLAMVVNWQGMQPPFTPEVIVVYHDNCNKMFNNGYLNAFI